MDVATFEEIQDEFMRRVRSVVWCTVATVDAKGRPRTRVLHPIWEGTTGWIATNRDSFKTKHLARNPFVSLGYRNTEHEHVYADCRAEWMDDRDEKARVWELIKNTPEPAGFDPGLIWTGGVDDAKFGLLKLTPWRIEVSGMAAAVAGQPPLVWRA